MDSDTESDQGEVDAYWRRRVYVVAAGIATIGLVAWACSGPDHKKTTAQVRNAAVNSTPTPTPAAAAATGPTPTVTVTVTARSTAAPPVRHRTGDRCDDGAVVIGLTPAKTVFAAKDHPRFRLSVVNTDRRACSFDVGPKQLRIRIMSGSDHVWSSEQCANGDGSDLRMLRRGEPYLADVDWDRKRCDGSSAGAGTYVIAAKEGAAKGDREIFRLR